jgi:hypothetical protein
LEELLNGDKVNVIKLASVGNKFLEGLQLTDVIEPVSAEREHQRRAIAGIDLSKVVGQDIVDIIHIGGESIDKGQKGSVRVNER